MHLTQEPAVETVLRSIADHGVDPARPTQRGRSLLVSRGWM
jgi:hypothetical protein